MKVLGHGGGRGQGEQPPGLKEPSSQDEEGRQCMWRVGLCLEECAGPILRLEKEASCPKAPSQGRELADPLLTAHRPR